MRNILSKAIFLTAFTMPGYLSVLGQDTVTKYYDADWAETSKERAIYYAGFIKQSSHYKCNSYWVSGNRRKGRAIYPDTSLANPMDEAVTYYKNGNIEDSVIYDAGGKIKNAYHYYDNKQLSAHYYMPEGSQQEVIEGFDETGKKIKNYVYAREAEFKGGDKAWTAYLQKNISKDFFNTKGDSEISVTLTVQFIIDENGYVMRPKIMKSSGMKNVDRDAITVISASPQWKNAMQYNKPVKAYRLQPLTYVLPPPKKVK